MDNTFFSGLTTSVSIPIGLALVSVVVIVILTLGASVGYRSYKRLVDWKDESH